MRIVRTPHQVIDIEQLAGQDSGAVVFESRPEITREIKAGRLVHPRLHPAPMVLPPMVHEAQQAGDPADAAFDDHEAQPRIALRDRAEDQFTHQPDALADLVVDYVLAIDPE